ncbi:MAG: transposase [Paracoccaceae bacterium]|nr:transposase [Paracoccaceae bacterium]MDE2912104.1 transposase [Paracoccaceae bacterium]
MSGDRHDMSDTEWEVFNSVVPHEHQGQERVHDRRVINGIFLVPRNGIFFVLRTGTPWRDLPEVFRPYTTCQSCYNRWSRNGIWALIMEELQRLAAMTVKASVLVNRPRLGSGGG